MQNQVTSCPIDTPSPRVTCVIIIVHANLPLPRGLFNFIQAAGRKVDDLVLVESHIFTKEDSLIPWTSINRRILVLLEHHHVGSWTLPSIVLSGGEPDGPGGSDLRKTPTSSAAGPSICPWNQVALVHIPWPNWPWELACARARVECKRPDRGFHGPSCNVDGLSNLPLESTSPALAANTKLI